MSRQRQPSTIEGISREAHGYLKRNFVLGVLNGAMWQLSEALMDPSLVLSWFMSQLTSSNFLIGLLSPIRIGGWFLPQLLISGPMQKQQQKLVLYRASSYVRCAALGALAAAIWWIDPQQTGLLLAVVFLSLSIFALGGGVSGLAFLEIVAKTIPAQRRGSYFAWRRFLGGSLAIGSSILVRYILSEQSPFTFPTEFAVLFTLAFVGITIAVTAFALTKEPIEHADITTRPLKDQLRRAVGFARADRSLRILILVRVLFIVGGLAAPFYIVYAKNVLDAPASSVGTYLMVSNLAAIISNPLWARISARQGNKRVIFISGLLGLAAPLATLAAGWSGSLTWLFLTFVCYGIYQGSVMIGQVGLGLDIAPAANRPTYLGLLNTVLGIFSLAGALSGLMVDLAGYATLFWSSAIAIIAALWLCQRLHDPRAHALAQERDNR